MRHTFHALLLSALLGAGWGSAQTFAIDADVADSYRQDERGVVTFRVSVDDGSLVDRAVVFLNVVQVLDDGGTPQAAHLIFDEAEVEGELFQRVLGGDELASGLDAALSFHLRADAQPGRYAVAVQVFRGETTDPHRVVPEDRLALSNFVFRLRPAADGE